jgi:hypothetical protein
LSQSKARILDRNKHGGEDLVDHGSVGGERTGAREMRCSKPKSTRMLLIDAKDQEVA